MKGNWDGKGTTPIQCPSWAILSLDHIGRVKQPCCIGSADNKTRPYSQFVKTTVLVAILSWWQMAFQVHSNTHHIGIALLRMLNTNISSIERKLLLIIELR